MPLQIIRQDITKMHVDAIVNTTNEKMVGFSGVDYAIHQAAGPGLARACARVAPLGVGEAKITKAYDLRAKYVIHTSGPVWHGGLKGESVLLRACYLESLKLAVAHRCKSVAFPLISSGTCGYPKEQVLQFAIRVITEFLFDHELMVYLCVFDRSSYAFSRELFSDIRAFIDDDYADMQNERGLEGSVILEAASAADFMDDEAEERRSFKMREASFERIPLQRPAPMPAKASSVQGRSLPDYLADIDKSFAYKLFAWIDIRGMTDVECYKKANIDKKTFSKIKCNPQTYKPSKQTAVAFAIALRLNLEETQDLLASAGLTLSRSFIFDKIIRYFIQKEIYDIFVINEALFEFDQVLLGTL